MHIQPRDTSQLEEIRRALWDRLRESRFTARIERRDKEISVKCVRVKKKRDYCGQHPGPCVVNPFVGEKKHKKAFWLEGADWIGFNRLLNDLLDEHGWEADIWSWSMEFTGKMRIRLGRRRRMTYAAECVSQFGHQQWLSHGEEDHFQDWVGREAPPETYPEGTPGHPHWREAS